MWTAKITNGGKAALSEWVFGSVLTITSAAAGAGTVPLSSLIEQTGLVDQLQQISIVGSDRVDGGIKIKLQITAPETGYDLQQIGIWGAVNDGTPVLIAIYQSDEAVAIPGSAQTPDFLYSFYGAIATSNQSAFTVVVDSAAFVTFEQLEPIVADLDARLIAVEAAEHFRGYYQTFAEIQALQNNRAGDYAYCAEAVPPSVTANKWLFNADTGEYEDSGVPVPDQSTPASDSPPLMDGEADPGESNRYARGDHVHPGDDSKADLGEDGKVVAAQLPTIGRIDYTITSATTEGLLRFQDMPNVRHSFTAVADANGSVLCIGGYNSRIVERYTLDGAYERLPDLNQECSLPGVVLDRQGSVLIFGGNSGSAGMISVERIDRFGTRSKLADMSVARSAPIAVLDGAGNVLVVDTSAVTNVVDRYSPDGVRTTLPPLSVSRSGIAAISDGDGNVLIAGGYSGSADSTVVDRYSPDGVRTTLTPLSAARRSLKAATDGNGNALFLGGISSSIVDRYDTGGNRTTLPSLSQPSIQAAETDGSGTVMALLGTGYVADRYAPNGAKTTYTLPSGWIAETAARDGVGRLLIFGTTGVPRVYRYTPPGIAAVPTAPGAIYQFEEHTEPQTAPGFAVSVRSPNRGYVQLMNNITL